MPSIFGHAVVGATGGYLAPHSKLQRRLIALSLLCSVFPDLDGLTLILGVPYDSCFGHRGFFHSVVFCVFTGYFATAFYLKKLKIRSLADWNWFFYFFILTLSHPLLDGMTNGGHGIAYFAPFNWHRYFFVNRPILVSPLSLTDFFGHAGILVLFREFLILFLPCLLLVFMRSQLHRLSVKESQLFRAGWFNKRILQNLRIVFPAAVVLTVLLVPLGLIREELIPGMNGVDVHQITPALFLNQPHGINEIPLEGVPGKRLIANYNELLQRHLLNTVLIPEKIPWSGTFFPTWLGGTASSWKEPLLIRAWKSLIGESLISKSDLVELIYRAQSVNSEKESNSEYLQARTQLDRLSPTEKYDIAVGDYYLGATHIESYFRGRGRINRIPKTPFWAGYCDSISLAAVYQKEPRVPVRVVNPDGYELVFYPNDIKALLAVAYLFIQPKDWDLGNRCELDGPKSAECLDVDPAALVIALTNRIGLAKSSFLIDKEPFYGIQNAPIRKVLIKTINPPYPVGERQSDFYVESSVKWLVDVEIQLTVSKITPLEPRPEEEDLTYRAILGMDSKLNLVGGRWQDPFHHPDFVWGGISNSTAPATVENALAGNRKMEWPVIQELVEQSSKSIESVQPVQIASLMTTSVPHGFVFQSKEDGLSGGISFLKISNPVTVYGHLEGRRLADIDSVELVSLREDRQGSSEEVKLASQNFQKTSDSTNNSERILFKLTSTQRIKTAESNFPTVVLLRFKKIRKREISSSFSVGSEEPELQFRIPMRKDFDSELSRVGEAP